MIKIKRGELYQIKVFSKDTKKCVNVIGEDGLTPNKLDKEENNLIKTLDWGHFWVETVALDKKI